MPSSIFESSIKSLRLLTRGKVRDIYEVDDKHLLIVTTDRLSAFDVILPTPIPDKGKILTELSNFWFKKLGHIIPNHLTGIPPESVVKPEEREQVEGRAIVVGRYKPLPVEAVARGYIEGSGWKEYQTNGAICGIALPAGLKRASRLPEPIFTPATKAELGAHDENISFAETERLLGKELAAQVRDTTLTLYKTAAEYALSRGIIIADTKFEFGLDADGKLFWIDEALTPDSSRFWPLDTYREGESPASFDKQFIRNWLESLGWNKQPPAPAAPADIAEKTAEKYREALTRLIG
ncbi:MAG TPA: phosphoribosylaminoimidazolesuccinocarboxamide synthase [Burkholderiales bacterium]|nr:phosphoribosylaminoimidazolesuccinocarboxamide synthase [Burkholderiales bacterium]